MTYDLQTGVATLRAEVIDKTIKGFATATYKFRQALTVSSTSAWKNTYFRENPTALTSPSGNEILGVPRGADFPQAVVQWEEKTGKILKLALEDNIFWEDIISNEIDIQNRTLFRISEGITSREDSYIWTGLTTDADIQTVSIEATKYWNGASAAIIDDLMQAKQKIGEYNYSTTNLIAFISEKDHRSIVKWLSDKGAQFPSVSEDMARNGRIGTLAGFTLVVSNNVAASSALVVVPKMCATLKELVPLTTNTTEDPLKSVRIRAAQEVQLQVTDPKAIVYITGTQGA